MVYFLLLVCICLIVVIWRMKLYFDDKIDRLSVSISLIINNKITKERNCTNNQLSDLESNIESMNSTIQKIHESTDSFVKDSNQKIDGIRNEVNSKYPNNINELKRLMNDLKEDFKIMKFNL